MKNIEDIKDLFSNQITKNTKMVFIQKSSIYYGTEEVKGKKIGFLQLSGNVVFVG